MRTGLGAPGAVEGLADALSEALLSFFGLRLLEGVCSELPVVTLLLASNSVSFACGRGTPPVDSGRDAEKASRSIFLGRRRDLTGASGEAFVGLISYITTHLEGM